jgi:hypothetical protein
MSSSEPPKPPPKPTAKLGYQKTVASFFGGPQTLISVPGLKNPLGRPRKDKPAAPFLPDEIQPATGGQQPEAAGDQQPDRASSGAGAGPSVQGTAGRPTSPRDPRHAPPKKAKKGESDGAWRTKDGKRRFNTDWVSEFPWVALTHGVEGQEHVGCTTCQLAGVPVSLTVYDRLASLTPSHRRVLLTFAVDIHPL